MPVPLLDSYAGRDATGRAAAVAERIQSKGVKALLVPTDVSNEIGVQRIVEQAIAVSGRVNILVNHVATYPLRLAFRSDGKQLAWCGYDGAVRVWDTEAPAPQAWTVQTLDWHRHEAREAETLRHWFAASVHLGHLIGAESSDSGHYLRRAWARTELGHAEGALADLTKAVELAPDPQRVYYPACLLRLRLGDREGYRRTCAEMLRRFREPSSPAVANAVAWNCVLGPDAVKDWSAVVGLAKQAVAAYPGNPGIGNTLGVALYRAGRYEDGIRQLEGVAKAQRDGATAQDGLFLAMAHHLAWGTGRTRPVPFGTRRRSSPSGTLRASTPPGGDGTAGRRGWR